MIFYLSCLTVQMFQRLYIYKWSLARKYRISKKSTFETINYRVNSTCSKIYKEQVVLLCFWAAWVDVLGVFGSGQEYVACIFWPHRLIPRLLWGVLTVLWCFRIYAAPMCNLLFPFIRKLECFLHILVVNKFAI